MILDGTTTHAEETVSQDATENTQPNQAESTATANATRTENIEDFASALESYSAESEAAPSEDHVIKGTVVKITPDFVVVDIGTKSEGMVPIAEVRDHQGNISLKPGDEISVMRE